jgi:hypothetical protein
VIVGGLLHAAPPPPETGWRALADDRGLIAVVLAIAAGLGFAEAGFMLIALLLILLRVTVTAAERG